MSDTLKTDVLIVGAGPVGIFASYQLGFLGMKSIIVDALDTIGGQLNALYPCKHIYDVPGFSKILAKDLIDNLVKQASEFDPVYLMSQMVMHVEKINVSEGFLIKTSKNITINAKAIIIAAGAGAFGPQKPDIENIESYEGKSIFYMVKNKNDFKDKNIVIVGGGDSAVDWAVELFDVAKKVYVVHRRNRFRAAESTVNKMQSLAKNYKDKIELVIPFMLDNVLGNNGLIEKVILKTLDGQKKEIEANALLAFYGLSRDLGFLEHFGFNINTAKSTIEVTSGSYETNIDGIFACGDIANYPHKHKLISVGFGEAALAAHCAWKYVFPNKAFHFVHSTSKE